MAGVPLLLVGSGSIAGDPEVQQLTAGLWSGTVAGHRLTFDLALISDLWEQPETVNLRFITHELIINEVTTAKEKSTIVSRNISMLTMLAPQLQRKRTAENVSFIFQVFSVDTTKIRQCF